MACVAVTSLVRTLELEFLQPQPRPIILRNELICCGNKQLIKSLIEKLQFLMEQFDEKIMDGVEAIEDLETKLRDVAFGVEDEIESQVAHLHAKEHLDDEEKTFHCLRLGHIFHRALGKPQGGTDDEVEKNRPSLRLRNILLQAIHDIDHIREELVKIKNVEYDNHHHVMDLQGRWVDSSKHDSNIEDIMVGKHDEFETIKKMLVEHPSKRREVVSIKGMGGIGKTTLARQIYDDASIASHFDKRAWVVVSQHHDNKKMLRDFDSVFQLKDAKTSSQLKSADSCRQLADVLYERLVDESFQLMNAESYTELAQKLYRCLKDQSSQIRNEESCLQLEELLDQCLMGESFQLDEESKKKLVDQLYKFKKELENVEYALLTEKLYQSLKGHRYFIVIDDVWSKEAWTDVHTFFPDDENGSRVMLTTRLEEVAGCTTSHNDFAHQMQLLDHSESWNLFCEKVLLKDICHDAEFKRIAKPIIDKCKGLPLAIVVAAGLFSKLNTPDEWKYIAKVLNLAVTTTIAEACSRILSLSYNHLPHRMKACFLYLGVFPEDKEIYAGNLARIWAAEGLVKKLKDGSVEVEEAESFVKELAHRNLIIVCKRGSDGRKIKTFQIHDVLHAFCVTEAQNQNLLNIVGKNGSSSHKKGFRWLSIQSSSIDIPTKSFLKNCRSIFYFVPFPPDLDLFNFNLLRVLYENQPQEWSGVLFYRIARPVHLRYLSSSKVSIFNSHPFIPWNLQTLGAVSSEYPCSFEFPRLCYCNCHGFSCEYPPNFVHQNMRSISTLSLSKCTKKLFSNIPHLKKVRIAITNDDVKSVDCIENLEYLDQLENLRLFACVGVSKYPISDRIARLKSLKKLSFFGTEFPWEEINVLSKLPWLEVLKLGYHACKGQEWILGEEDKFCSLISLQFEGRDLGHWKICGDGHFPKLERLLLTECYKLEEIPECLAEMLTLKSIELWKCLSSTVASARQILEEQHDQGNKDMIVIENNTM